MRIVGLDIHRVFAEAVMLDDGRAVQLGRIGMTREHLAAFARKLKRDATATSSGRAPVGRETAGAAEDTSAGRPATRQQEHLHRRSTS